MNKQQVSSQSLRSTFDIQDAIRALEPEFGPLRPSLIHENPGNGNTVFLLKGERDRYILKKVKRSEDTHRDLQRRELLASRFQAASITQYVIPDVVYIHEDRAWLLTRFEIFESLYDIYKRDKVGFRKVIDQLYHDILLPLLKKLDHDTPIPGEWGLNDIGYQKGIFYFFDFDSEKSLIRTAVDVYAKLIHLYYKTETLTDKKLLQEILQHALTMQRSYVDSRVFNVYLLHRLESPTLKQVLGGQDPKRVLEQFGYSQ